MYIYLSDEWKSQTDGLCGNYDGSALNDFGIHQTVNDFGNSWKTRATCPNPDIDDEFDPCVVCISNQQFMFQFSYIKNIFYEKRNRSFFLVDVGLVKELRK